MLMIDLCGEMLTVTHETRAEKRDAEIDREPIDLGLCPLSPIAVFVDQFKTAQSHSFVEESLHLIGKLVPPDVVRGTSTLLGHAHMVHSGSATLTPLAKVDIQFAQPVH